MSRLFDEADRIFVADQVISKVLADLKGTRGVGPHDLYRLLTEDDAEHAAWVTPILFRSPRLRRQFASLGRSVATVTIPELAAASDGVLTEREFQGGKLRIEQDPDEGETYVIIELEPPTPSGPQVLLTLTPDISIERRELPPFDSAGRAMLILGDTPADKTFVAGLQDPNFWAALVGQTPSTEV
jgi:hypothetical protein